MRVQLPCGIVKDDVVYDHVVIKEITGKQQNYLTDFDLVGDTLGHIPKLLADLVTDYQTKDGKPADIKSEDAIWMLPTEDIETVLVKIREATYGKNFALQVTCPACAKVQTISLDLSKLKIKKLKDKTKRVLPIKLKKSGVKAEVRLMYLQDLFDLNKAIREANKEFYTTSLALSLAKLGDKGQITSEDLKDLPITDLQQIDTAFEKLRGSIDNRIQHGCIECKFEFETPLPVVEPAFFGPSTTLSI